MPVVEQSVEIDRSPEFLFDYLCTAENFPVWDSSVQQAEQVSDGPVRVGTRIRGTSKILGRRFDWTTEVEEFDPPRRIVNTSVEGRLSFSVTITVEPVGDATRCTYRIDADSGLGGVFGRLADPLVERAQNRTVRANLDTLAEVMKEEGATG